MAWLRGTSILVLALGPFGGTAGHADPVADRITAMVQPCIDRHWLRGAVVGITCKGSSQVLCFGQANDRSKRAPDRRTLFEIGSITKVFTATALADMVIQKEVQLDDPVARCLPAGTVVPALGSRQITLVDLATHTSGLPSLPSNFRPTDWADPYADYTDTLLYAFLKTFTLARLPGASYDYSNLGAGLLGYALALKDRASYDELIARRVTRPLGLEDTTVSLSAEQTARSASGSNADLDPVPAWHFGALAGAGGLHSNVEEMLTFLQANLGHDAQSLGPALDLAQTVQRPAAAGVSVGLGWHILTGDGTRAHNGSTGGFHSYMAFLRDRDTAVVVLSNTQSDLVENLGASIFRVALGAPVDFQPPPAEVTLTAAELSAYPATYRFDPAKAVVITQDGGRLQGQLPGKDPVRLYASERDRFFCKVLHLVITFQRDASGAVTGLTVHQNGQDLHAVRSR